MSLVEPSCIIHSKNFWHSRRRHVFALGVQPLIASCYHRSQSLCTIKWDKPESETLDFRSLPTEWWRLSLWLHGTTNCSVAEMSRPFHLWGWMSIWSDRFLCLLFLLSDWLGANGRTHQAHQLLWPKLLHRCDNHLFQPFILECGKTLTIILWSHLCGWCSFSLQPNPMLCFSLKLIWTPPLPLCSF